MAFKKDNKAGKKFKKGQSGNPKGRPKRILKLIKESGYSKEDALFVFKEMGWKDEKAIKKILTNENSPAIAQVIARAFIKAINTGEYRYVSEILQYVVGKPVEEHKHEIDSNETVNIIIK